MSQVPGPRSLAPPPCYGPGDGLPQRVEYARHACICTCAWIYAPACPHRHMHAWRKHVGICAQGMHAPTYACMACVHICMPHPMCTSTPHPTGRGGEGMTMSGALPRWILWAPPRSTPHPTGGGGGASPSLYPHPWWVGGKGDHWHPGHIYIYIYKLIYTYTRI